MLYTGSPRSPQAFDGPFANPSANNALKGELEPGDFTFAVAPVPIHESEAFPHLRGVSPLCLPPPRPQVTCRSHSIHQVPGMVCERDRGTDLTASQLQGPCGPGQTSTFPLPSHAPWPQLL